jgi:hypothetical protein
VRNYARGQGFDLILSAEATVSFAPTIDVTPAILAALQARAGVPAGTPKPATPATPAKPQAH